MKAWLGWVAAVLLIALAFTGGPEAIDSAPPAAQTKISAGAIAEKREPQVRDDDAGQASHAEASATVEWTPKVRHGK